MAWLAMLGEHQCGLTPEVVADDESCFCVRVLWSVFFSPFCYVRPFDVVQVVLMRSTFLCVVERRVAFGLSLWTISSNSLMIVIGRCPWLLKCVVSGSR